jgi:hypothetical protein
MIQQKTRHVITADSIPEASKETRINSKLRRFEGDGVARLRQFCGFEKLLLHARTSSHPRSVRLGSLASDCRLRPDVSFLNIRQMDDRGRRCVLHFYLRVVECLLNARQQGRVSSF